MISTSPAHASFKKAMRLENYSGNLFDLEIKRTIRLMDKKSIEDSLGVVISDNINSYDSFPRRNAAFPRRNAAFPMGNAAFRTTMPHLELTMEQPD